MRGAEEARRPVLIEKLGKVIEEVKFFKDYTHHVATSDHVGDVLKRVYMIPEDIVHIIVNGVDDNIYRPDPVRGEEFRRKTGVPETGVLVIGMTGRLVKDKEHPLMHEALKQIFLEDERIRRDVFVLVAEDGLRGSRFKDLGGNIIALGPLDHEQMAVFYNALDVFVNPMLRAQGLDHTFIEAMLSGVCVMGTGFASITGSLIVGPEIGYTLPPAVDLIKELLYTIVREGEGVLKKKGEAASNRAIRLFTATKMAAANERVFLCISKEGKNGDGHGDYCRYSLPGE